MRHILLTPDGTVDNVCTVKFSTLTTDTLLALFTTFHHLLCIDFRAWYLEKCTVFSFLQAVV